MDKRWSYQLATLAVVLAFVVVILGAYTRLTHAGLGCPDWPGCYGHMIVPDTQKQISRAEKAFPGAPLEEAKAWTEMTHRYAAGTLGLIILIIAVIAVVQYFRREQRRQPLVLPLFLLLLIIFQAALGMWTVTWKLLPIVVMSHLLGGLTVLACLWWLRLKLANNYRYSVSERADQFKPWALLGLIIVYCQIALGGWVSANYAGLACIGFPFCNGQLLPTFNFHEAYNLFHPIGVNYQGGVMDSSARVTIHMVHRIGALLTFLYVGILSIILMRFAKIQRVRSLAVLIAILLCIQILLGIVNVTHLLPLSAALAHNAVAVLLLLAMVTLNYYLRKFM